MVSDLDLLVILNFLTENDAWWAYVLFFVVNIAYFVELWLFPFEKIWFTGNTGKAHKKITYLGKGVSRKMTQGWIECGSFFLVCVCVFITHLIHNILLGGLASLLHHGMGGSRTPSSHYYNNGQVPPSHHESHHHTGTTTTPSSCSCMN